MGATIEKRRFPRLFFNVDVEYKKLEEGESSGIKTRSKNISARGIRLILLEKIKLQTNIELRFSLPDTQEKIVATGKVVWIEEFSVGDAPSNLAYDAGIEFITVSKADRERIVKFPQNFPLDSYKDSRFNGLSKLKV
jgi:c-di-GMP-binding flagellar brake protein YcgR